MLKAVSIPPLTLQNSGLVVTASLHRLPIQRKSPVPPPIRRPIIESPSPSQWTDTSIPIQSNSVPIQTRRSGEIGEEMKMFLELVPARMRGELGRHEEIKQLVEIVMDLGREPVARFPSGDWVVSSDVVGVQDLKHAISKVGDFAEDNRSGINRSLHRISAIRNRKMQIIGLTCRVGRSVSGSAEMIRDLVTSGNSILVIGPPGVGKTTLIREIARILADEQKKRVVIVDTSNEIGGDGDVPHSGIGRARRMQVPKVSMQHDVMIEAVENHMPEVIVIDEIGTELEALAASTISQRGVQLVGTAHGVTIESLTKNPSLQVLVGGIESVTLSDEVAKKRKVQKSILERKGPPAFSCAIELTSKTECRVHHKLDATVDHILQGMPPKFELRKADGSSSDSNSSLSIFREDKEQDLLSNMEQNEFSPQNNLREKRRPSKQNTDSNSSLSRQRKERSLSRSAPVNVYVYEMSKEELLSVASVMGDEAELGVTDDIRTASAILVSRSEMKRNPWIRKIAKSHSIPVFVIKSNTMAQLAKAIQMILGKDSQSDTSAMSDSSATSDSSIAVSQGDIEIQDDAPKRKPSLEEIDALEEARLAIEYIVIPGGEPVELLPRCSEIIARQLALVESYQLSAETSGTEFGSRLQILPIRTNKKSTLNPSLNPNKSGLNPDKSAALSPNPKESTSVDFLNDMRGGASVSRLPLLPE